MANSPSEQERIFREWLRNQFDANGLRKHSDNAIISYSYALRTACNKMTPPIGGNLFGISDKDEFVHLHQQLNGHPDFEQINRETGNGAFSIALRLYQQFLVQGTSIPASTGLNATMMLNRPVSSIASYSENRGMDSNYNEISMDAIQRIYYGAPGTGKSHTVSTLLEAEYPDRYERDRHCKRLIFHPTYTYEDFVGCIKPLMSLDKPLDYVYVAGPFTTLLKEAFLHPRDKYFLVIEEINRGNTPAIFGDLFQLLDRADDGKSAYSIQNTEVSAYFTRDPGLKKLFEEGKIWLPANFNIIATMNTADENIFVLDSAFKRRFEMEYVRIEFEKMPEKWTKEYSLFVGTRPLLQLFEGTMVEDFAKTLESMGELKRDWPTFARIVNHIIDKINLDLAMNDVRDIPKIPENKKIGPYFVSEDELQSLDKFVNKVVFYLKQDVFTYSNHYMLCSFEELHYRYVVNRGDLFELLV